MAQISRPFQVVLAAFVLFAIAWFALLHRPGTSSTSSSAPASSVAPHPHVPAHTRTVASAHATAKTHHASVTVHHSSVTHTTTHTAAPAASHKATVDPRSTRTAPHSTAAPAKSPATPAMQATVAAELKQHKVVLLLFWNPSSSSDAAVHRQVQIVAHKLGHGVAVHTSAASQVSSYGSITRDIQVYQTPTLLVINPHGQVTTVTGYTDAYALEQTIREARG